MSSQKNSAQKRTLSGVAGSANAEPQQAAPNIPAVTTPDAPRRKKPKRIQDLKPFTQLGNIQQENLNVAAEAEKYLGKKLPSSITKKIDHMSSLLMMFQIIESDKEEAKKTQSRDAKTLSKSAATAAATDAASVQHVDNDDVITMDPELVQQFFSWHKLNDEEEFLVSWLLAELDEQANKEETNKLLDAFVAARCAKTQDNEHELRRTMYFVAASLEQILVLANTDDLRSENGIQGYVHGMLARITGKERNIRTSNCKFESNWLQRHLKREEETETFHNLENLIVERAEDDNTSHLGEPTVKNSSSQENAARNASRSLGLNNYFKPDEQFVLKILDAIITLFISEHGLELPVLAGNPKPHALLHKDIWKTLQERYAMRELFNMVSRLWNERDMRNIMRLYGGIPGLRVAGSAAFFNLVSLVKSSSGISYVAYIPEFTLELKNKADAVQAVVFLFRIVDKLVMPLMTMLEQAATNPSPLASLPFQAMNQDTPDSRVNMQDSFTILDPVEISDNPLRFAERCTNFASDNKKHLSVERIQSSTKLNFDRNRFIVGDLSAAVKTLLAEHSDLPPTFHSSVKGILDFGLVLSILSQSKSTQIDVYTQGTQNFQVHTDRYKFELARKPSPEVFLCMAPIPAKDSNGVIRWCVWFHHFDGVRVKLTSKFSAGIGGGPQNGSGKDQNRNDGGGRGSGSGGHNRSGTSKASSSGSDRSLSSTSFRQRSIGGVLAMAKDGDVRVRNVADVPLLAASIGLSNALVIHERFIAEGRLFFCADWIDKMPLTKSNIIACHINRLLRTTTLNPPDGAPLRVFVKFKVSPSMLPCTNILQSIRNCGHLDILARLQELAELQRCDSMPLSCSDDSLIRISSRNICAIYSYFSYYPSDWDGQLFDWTTNACVSKLVNPERYTRLPHEELLRHVDQFLRIRYFVTEFLITHEEYIKALVSSGMNLEQQIRDLFMRFAEMSLGLTFLHTNKIGHSDVSPNNFMFRQKRLGSNNQKSFEAVVTDLDECNWLGEQKRVATPAFSEYGTNYGVIVDEAGDIFSLALVFENYIQKWLCVAVPHCDIKECASDQHGLKNAQVLFASIRKDALGTLNDRVVKILLQFSDMFDEMTSSDRGERPSALAIARLSIEVARSSSSQVTVINEDSLINSQYNHKEQRKYEGKENQQVLPRKAKDKEMRHAATQLRAVLADRTNLCK